MCVFIRVKDGQDCRTETLQGQTRSDRADSVSLHTHVSMHDILHAAHTHTFITLQSNSLTAVRHTGHQAPHILCVCVCRWWQCFYVQLCRSSSQTANYQSLTDASSQSALILHSLYGQQGVTSLVCDEFAVPIISFQFSSSQHDVHFANPCLTQSEIEDKAGCDLGCERTSRHTHILSPPSDPNVVTSGSKTREGDGKDVELEASGHKSVYILVELISQS